MRIVHLAPPAATRNGIADYALHWRAAMQAAGAEFVQPVLGSQPGADALAAVKLHEADLVHAELGGGRMAEFEALAYLRRHCPQLPLTATVHDPERLIWRSRHLPPLWRALGRLPGPAPQLAGLLDHPRVLRLERALAQQLDALICMTERGSTALRQRMHLDAELGTTIAHGNPAIAPRALPEGPLRLLYFGYIYPGKGIEDLLTALAGLAEAWPTASMPIRLTLAGGRSPEIAFGSAGDYIAELDARIASLRLQPYIDWHFDVADHDMVALIQAHHVMVLPYRESKKLAWLGQMRSTSGALSWATACGRGALVSDARAFAEEISYGNGGLFKQRDPADLQQQLQQLLANPQRVQGWAEHAGQLALQRQWPRIAGQYMACFEQARQRRSQRHG